MRRRSGAGELFQISRRRFLSPLAILPLRWCVPYAAQGLDPANDSLVRVSDLGALQTAVTANDDFYVRNHFAVPRLAEPAWKLEVTGRVRSPFELTYADLLRQPAQTLTVTLECAGNTVGGGEVGTAAWTGISLATLLKRASLAPGAKYIRLVGADRGVEDHSQPPMTYARTIPLEKALEEPTMLAYQMNHVPLPPQHGYPVRAIIPGWYGMDSVKWLTRIEALDHEDTSFFMRERYVARRLQVVGSEQRPVTRMLVKSLITQPREAQTLAAGAQLIRGVAWAGKNSVAKVEVSTNDGRNWESATLAKALEPYAWVQWTYLWQATTPGAQTLMARVTDSQGNEQPSKPDALRLDRYELNSWQSVRCRVR